MTAVPHPGLQPDGCVGVSAFSVDEHSKRSPYPGFIAVLQVCLQAVAELPTRAGLILDDLSLDDLASNQFYFPIGGSMATASC